MAQNAVFREQVRALIQEEGDGWEDQVLDTVTQLENELEVSKLQATVYKQDFERERKDREEAHGRHQTDVNHLTQQLDQFMLDATTGNQCVQCNQQLAEWKRLETVKNQEICQLREELQALSWSKQNADKELTKLRDAIARMKQIQNVTAEALSELKARYDAEVTQVNDELREKNDQLHQYSQRVQTLEEDIQAKTAQVKQYKKQVDQFREQVEVGTEQAEIHKAQVTLSELKARYDTEVTQVSDELREKNDQLHQYSQRVQTLEDKGFVLVLGDDTLKQQVADLKEQLRVLQIVADTYKEDFLRERNDRASTHGAKDDFRKSMKKAEAENKQLKQRFVMSESTNRPNISNTNGGNRSPENSTASDQKCRELTNHVHQLEEVVQHLQRQLERALAEPIELNELKNRQKQQEEYAHALEQERDQLQQQILRSSHNDFCPSRPSGHLPPISPAVRGGRPVMLANISGENIPVYHGVQFPVRDKPIPMHCSEMFPGLQDQRPVYNPFKSEDEPPIRAIDPGLMRTEGGMPNHHMLRQYNQPTSPIASSARPSNMYVGQQSTNSYGNLSPSTLSPHADAALERNDSPVFSGSFDESPYNERRQPQWACNASNVPMPQQQPNIPTNYHVNPHQQGAQTLYRNLPLHLSHPGRAGIPSPNTRTRFEQPQTQSPSQPPSLPPKQRQNYDYPQHINSDPDQILPALPPKPTENFQSRQLPPHREEIATPPLPPKPTRAEHRNTAGYCESKAAALQTIGDQPENVTISDLPPSHIIVATSSSYMLDGLDGKDSRSRDTNKHAPFDPNLVCPVCKKKFRYDEPQKCGAHIRRCLGDREERVQEWVSHVRSECSSGFGEEVYFEDDTAIVIGEKLSLRELTEENSKLREIKECQNCEIQKSNSSANQLTEMEADLGRIRTERDELKQSVSELSQKSAYLKEVEVLYKQCQQKSIAQTAVIDQRKELNDLKREVPGLKGALTKQHTELQQVAEQIDELEAYKQMKSVPRDDRDTENEVRD